MKTNLTVQTKARVMLFCGLLFVQPQLALAQIPVASGATNTTVANAGNGVPVVNIAAPSASGLSHNKFTSYNVDINGLVLNNGDKSTNFRQSQLAGQIAANPNLAAGNQASIILNEVTGSNRSLLAGFTEVLGGRASVVVANPFGITCNGCGFINTDRVSLVTGTPNVAGGVLGSFDVRGGDILIGGTGLNASAQQMLDLVSRRITVNGQVNAPTLNLVAGANNWNYATGATTLIASDGTPTPSWAIDSSALGGMYAGRIVLKSTAAGAGVRTLGNAAATADDFAITSAGRIEIRSQVSAARDLSLTSASTDTDAIKAVDANMTAGRHLALTATGGGATLTGGGIVATGALNYTLGTLTDTASATAGITDANKRYGATTNLAGAGAWSINGVSYGAGSSLDLTAASLSVGSSAAATLYSGGTLGLTASSGNLALANAAVQSVNGLALTSSNGALSFGGATKVKSTTGTLIMSALTGLANAGTLTADAGSVSIRTNGAIANSGTIYADGLLDIADRSGVWATRVDNTDGGPVTVNDHRIVTNSVANTGTLQGGTLSLLSSALSVTGGGRVESAGNMNLGVVGQLTIGSGSRIVAATSGNGTGTIRGNSDENITPYQTGGEPYPGFRVTPDPNLKRFSGLTNSGTLSSGQHLSLLGKRIENTASGSIGAANNIAVDAFGDLLNAGNIVSSAGGVALINNSYNTQLTNSGTISAAGLLQVSHYSGNFVNRMSNTGKMLGGTVNIQAENLAVTGGGSIESRGDLTIVASNQIDIGAAGDTTSRILAATSGSGTGTVSSNRTVYVSSGTQGDDRYFGTLNNYGVLFSGNDLVLGGAGVNNKSTGGISALRNLTVTNPNAVATVYNEGSLYAGQDMIFNAWDTFNYGGVYAVQNLYWTMDRYLQNYALIDALGSVSLIGNDSVINRSTIVSGNTLFFAGYSPNDASSGNSGTLTAPTITLEFNSVFENTGIIRGGTVSQTLGSILNSGGGTFGVGYVTVPTTTQPTPASVSATPGAVSAGATAFPGLNLTLPSNPNGLFIPARNPNSQYLVESNPLFTNLDNFLGSDYLADKYNFKPDAIIKRLGDAAYETSLVQQQLLTQAGTGLLSGYTSQKAQMQGLMDHAASQAGNLGLSYGKALTSTQLANLKEDMVWMVETTVGGQKVLAPVVYLAASTREMFKMGSGIINADTLNMNVGSLTNTGGGSISGTTVKLNVGTLTNTGGGTIDGKTLNVVAEGDITNVGSTIKGGEVSLVSTGGSIVNKTELIKDKNGKQFAGQQAMIQSTGTLTLDAGKNITNIGATMDAGGDANLSAKGDVTFDTLAVTNKSFSNTSSKGFFKSSESDTSTVTTTQVKSGLTSGGNLTVKAKNDITLAGTDVTAKGKADLDAGGDLNILDRTNKSKTFTNSRAEGLGVGGGLWGTETTKTETFKSTSVGSKITSGTDTSLAAGKTLTVRGSDVNAKDNLDISATDLKVLAGKNDERTITTKETTTIFSISAKGSDSYTAEADAGASADAKANAGGANAGAGAKADAGAKAGYETDTGGTSESKAKSASAAKSGSTGTSGLNASAKANADASASAGGTSDVGGIDFDKTIKTTTTDEKTKSVASSLSGGRNVTIKAKKDIVIQGSSVAAKGDVDLTGDNVVILAGEDTHKTSSKTTVERSGLYLETTNKADISGSAKVGAAGGTSGANAEIGAEAKGSVSSSTNLNILRADGTKTETADTTNKESTVGAGGNLRISANRKLTVQGSDVSGDQGVDVKAKDMEFLAGKDTHTSTTTTIKASVGMYAEADVSANAGAGANAKGSVGASGGANAEANVSGSYAIGFQGSHATGTESEGSSTARVSTITSTSGSITRTAENSIKDVGTAIDAAGDFSQSAKTFTSKAAENTKTSSSSSMTNTGKIGMYSGAEAGASADASGSAGLGASGSASADATAKVEGGVRGSYTLDIASASSKSSDAGGLHHQGWRQGEERNCGQDQPGRDGHQRRQGC